MLLSDIFIVTIMKSIIRNWIILTTVALCFSACEKESVDSSSIIGKWELTNHNVISNGQLGYNFDYKKEVHIFIILKRTKLSHYPVLIVSYIMELHFR